MVALSDEYMVILKKVIDQRYVPFLPELLGKDKLTIEDQQKKQISRGFSAFVFQKMFGLSAKDATQCVVDDYQDNGIDAFYYDEKSETLYLLQTKLKKTEPFKQDDANEFCKGVRLFCRQEFSSFNTNFQKRIDEAENAVDECSHIHLIVAYVGNSVALHAEKSFEEMFSDAGFDEDRLVKKVTYFDYNDVVKHLLEEQEFEKINIRLSFLKYDKIEDPRKTYFGIVKLSDLVDLHKVHAKSLYQKNIRYYLGATKSGVNESIKRTLELEPENFFYLNNGITAVCDVVEPKSGSAAGRNLKIRNFSIINGAQSVATAAEFSLLNPSADISEAKVMLTLIQAQSDGSFGKKITRSRNHQNPVHISAFAALDDNQERLRKELAMLNINYHYRPELEVPTDSKNITRMDALRALAALQMDSRFPAIMKLDIARISNPTTEDYRKIFTNELTGFKLINAVNCYKKFHELILQAQNGSKGFEKLVYRHGFFMLLHVFIKRCRDEISKVEIVNWNTPQANTVFSYEIDVLRQKCLDIATKKLVTKGALAFFRNQTDTVPFLTQFMEEYYNISNDSAVISMKSISSTGGKTQLPEEYPRKKLVDYMSSKAPQLKLSST